MWRVGGAHGHTRLNWNRECDHRTEPLTVSAGPTVISLVHTGHILSPVCTSHYRKLVGTVLRSTRQADDTSLRPNSKDRLHSYSSVPRGRRDLISQSRPVGTWSLGEWRVTYCWSHRRSLSQQGSLSASVYWKPIRQVNRHLMHAVHGQTCGTCMHSGQTAVRLCR